MSSKLWHLAVSWVLASAALSTAQECTPARDQPEEGEIIASFLARVSYGGKPSIYVDKGGEIYQLDCPGCPTLAFGDRLSIKYQSLMQCRSSHVGVIESFSKIGSDPNAGEKLIHHMDGVVAATTSASGFRFDPAEKDPMISEWTFDVAEQALMDSVHPGERVKLKYFVSGCAGAVMFCTGVALGIESSPAPIQEPAPLPQSPSPPVEPTPATPPPATSGPQTGPGWSSATVLGISGVGLAALLIFGLRGTTAKKATTAYNPSRGELALVQQSNDLQAWNESAITAQLIQLRDRTPSMIPHYVASIKERFIVKQDDRTAQARLKFMHSQIDQLKLAKEFQQVKDDLEILSYEREKRIKTLQFETEELDGKRESSSELTKLNTLRERKKLELEIAQLDQQIAGLKNPPLPEAKPNPEQQRANDRSACEARIQNLKAEKQKALKLDDETERILKVNAIDDALQREMERWAKLL